MFLPVYTGTKP